MAAQQDNPDTVFHVNVNMVQLDVAVTDKKGNYITGLSPWDFAIYEDGIAQKMATFGEENEVPRSLEDYPRRNAALGAAPPTKTGRQAREGAVQPLLRKESPDRIASMVAGQVSSSFSIPATTCTRDLYTPRMPLRNSSARSTIRTG